MHYLKQSDMHCTIVMKYVGEELTISMPEKPTIRCDASVAIGFAGCVEGVGRMKHIDLGE